MVRRLFTLCSLLIVLGITAATLPAYAIYGDDAETQASQPVGPAGEFTAISAGATKSTIGASDDGPGVYLVQLADPPVALYDGGIAGLRGTSPRSTGRAKIDTDAAEVQAYLQYLDRRESQVLAAIAGIVGDTVTPVQTYRFAINGFAATFTPAQAAAIASLPGVKLVQRDRIMFLHTDRGPTFIGATQANLEPTLFQATLDGDQETPPVTTEATGRAIASYDAATKEISFNVSYQGLSGAATNAHIHIGATGVAGGVVVPIFDTAVGTPGTSGAFIGTKIITDVGAPVNMTADQIEDALFAGDLYFNIHTAANSAGEIRGQISAARGEGIIVGVIDSGIDPTSPSVADVGGDGYDHTNPLGSGNYLGVCSDTDDDGRFDATFACNDKLIGAFTYNTTDEFPDPQGGASPRDHSGHGTHTASTAAGNVVATTVVNGTSTGSISGVAPHSNLIVFDACGTEPAGPQNVNACSGSAIVAAVDDAVASGVDVINMSIGGGSRDPWGFLDSIGFLTAFDAGIFSALSIGNEGPGASTAGSPGNAPWVMGTAASTHDRVFVNNLENFSGGDAGTRPTSISGKGVTAGLPATSIIYAGDVGNALCDVFEPAEAAEVAGKIVVCDRGIFGRVEKAQNVADAGGAGYVLANDAASGNSLVGDAYPIPGVHITFADGEDLKAWLTGCSDCEASISGAVADIDPAYGDVMASFSSRGPDASVPDVIKPDVAAPGVDILAAYADFDPANPDYAFSSGTSMASPHVAGAGALLRQLHPDWTPAEIKSALMTTAITSLLKEDGATPTDPFDRGAGRINVEAAARAGLVFNATTDEMLAADPFFDGEPNSINLASVAEDACVVTCTFTRTVRSTLGVAVDWTATSTTPTSMTITVEPDSFTLAAGATQTITITADVGSAALNEGYVFGEIALTPSVAAVPTATIPVAIQPAASNLPQRITINTASREGSATKPVRSVAVSDLTTNVYGLVRTTPVVVNIPEDPTPGDPIDSTDGITIVQVTLPAGTTRYHVRTTDSTAPDLDLYIYLDGLVAPDLQPQEGELICSSTTSTADEWCDLTVGGGPSTMAATILVVVQNWEGSGAATDSFNLYSGIVGSTATGNLTVTGPETNPAGETFDLTFNYNLEDASEGDLYVGLIRLGTAPGSAGDLGYSLVDVIFDSYNLFVPMAAQ